MKRIAQIAVLAIVVIVALYYFCPKPELKGFHTYSRVYCDRNGILLRITLAHDEQYRLYVPLEEISPIFQEATLIYEDQYYYQHAGIDPIALCRAFWDTYVVRHRKIGASTITMQVARLRWDIQSGTVYGKLIQIIRALQLTRHYNKREILEAYFNLAPYGRNIEGIEAASLIYFNKHAAALSLPESLTLSVIPQNPGKRNPTTKKGFAELRNARENLFHRWIQSHEEDENKQVFLELPLSVRAPEQLPFRAPHFINNLNSQLPRSQHGLIKTTLDWNQQTAIENMVSGCVERRKSDGIKNAVAMLINYQTMEVRALVGSADFFDPTIDGQVNGTTAKRSPGSALKPFVYALAMDQGLIHPMTLLKDAPKRFAGFTPENFDKRFLGPVFAKDALITSRNVPAVYLQAQLSKPNFFNFLQQAGIRRLKQESFYGLALALGGAEVTMEELVSLYAMLPNRGALRPVKKLLKDNLHKKRKDVRLISPESSFLLLDILKDNPQPMGTILAGQVYDRNEIAWKTGTSFAFRDAWAVGISGPHVLAVWVGNFQGDGNPNFIGRQAAGPLLFEIFSVISNEKNWHVTDAIQPGLLNIKRVTVCAKTGDLPVRYCPNTDESWFIPGVSPIKVSTIHRAIPIDKETGLRSCWFDPQNSEMKIFEFWPSDLLHIFQMAGISLKVPPQYKDDCSLNEKSASGRIPVIRSPQATITYALQSHRLGKERIPFSAIVDADVNTLYWFVDNQFVGKVNNERPFFWKPMNGNFNVRVVDDHGRAAERNITVEVVR